jgi:hypothetical protein
MVWHGHTAGRGKVITSAHLWGTDTSSTFKRERIGEGEEKYTYLHNPRQCLALFIFISALSLLGVQGILERLLLSSLDWSNLVP